MQQDIPAQRLDNSQLSFRLLNIPDECPLCHRNIHPKTIFAATLEGRFIVQALFRCTHQKCQEIFIGTYQHTVGSNQCKLIKVSPVTPKKESFSEIISDLSPEFVAIYNQSLAAEAANLSQLVGIGIRKAIEFLVKDFAVREHKENEEEIRKLFLGRCIDDYIKDTNIKECAKRAVWLGNDETHYTRKWEDKDINDLKLLTKLTVNWIENVILTEKYISEMDEKKT